MEEIGVLWNYLVEILIVLMAICAAIAVVIKINKDKETNEILGIKNDEFDISHFMLIVFAAIFLY